MLARRGDAACFFPAPRVFRIVLTLVRAGFAVLDVAFFFVLAAAAFFVAALPPALLTLIIVLTRAAFRRDLVDAVDSDWPPFPRFSLPDCLLFLLAIILVSFQIDKCECAVTRHELQKRPGVGPKGTRRLLSDAEI